MIYFIFFDKVSLYYTSETPVCQGDFYSSGKRKNIKKLFPEIKKAGHTDYVTRRNE